MNFIDKYTKKKTISSLELLEQINFFRGKEEDKTELGHNDLLKVIRDEFDEEIREGKISQSSYKKETGNGTIREYPMFELIPVQARQVLIRESKNVRRAVIHYIDKLENEVQELRMKEYQRLLTDNQRMLLENKDIKDKNEELEYQNGNGKYLKAITNIEWLKDYFYTDKTGFIPRIVKELILLSDERRIPYDGIYPTFSNKEVLVFHIDIYRAFKEILDNDEELKIMPKYRKKF